MILALGPGQPQIEGDPSPLPAGWKRWLAPWATYTCNRHPFGTSLIQQLDMRGFSIFIWRLRVDTGVLLWPTAEKPTIAMQFTLEGRIACELAGFGPKILEQGKYELFYVPAIANQAWFEPGEYESLHIELKPEYIEDIFGAHPHIAVLVSRLAGSSQKGMPMAVARINYITGAALKGLRSCEKKGGALQLELHKYILEMLSEYLSDIMLAEDDKAIPYSPYKEILLRIKEHLLAAPDVHAHTQKKIAVLFGISETTLKRQFKRSFGTTVSRFVRYHALSKAHYLLTSSRRTIDDIAEETGYSNRAAFEDAFHRHFGYLPAKLRSGLNP